MDRFLSKNQKNHHSNQLNAELMNVSDLDDPPALSDENDAALNKDNIDISNDEASGSDDGRRTPTYKRKRRNELDKDEKCKHRIQKFRPAWTSQPEYKTWLRPDLDNPNKARCIKCKISFTAELTVIKNHVKGKKHKKIASASSVCSQNIIKKFTAPQSHADTLLNDNVKIAEIKLGGFLAEHNIAFNVMDHMVELLKSIFPDSKICNKINLKRTKVTNIIKHVIAPSSKNDLANILKATKFSMMIDESTDVACESTMCIIVRYYSVEKECIVSRFWSLVQVYDKKNADQVYEGATGQNLFNACIDSLKDYNIPLENLIGFGSDGCNAMFGASNSVTSRLKEQFPGIFLMKCICHSLHLVCSEACKMLPRRCEELARHIYSFFSHSSKRQSQFYQFQNFLVKDHKMLHPSATRWLSLSSVVIRIVEQWDALRLFFSEKWLKEKLIGTQIIYEQLNDPFTKAFFYFLEWALPKFVLLNKYFQTEKVVLDQLHEKMTQIYKDILLCFLKRDYVMRTPLAEIDPKDETKMLDAKNLYLGVKITNYMSKKEITRRPDLLSNFYSKCKDFLQTSCIQLKKRYDFNDPVLPLLNCLNPKEALSNMARESTPSILSLIQKLPRIVNSENENEIQVIDDQWRLLPLESFSSVITEEKETDKFWSKLYNYKHDEIVPYKELAKFFLSVLSLPHSNADCERMFSKINRTKTSSRNRMITDTVSASLMACELLSNSSNSDSNKKGNCITFKPTIQMLKLMQSNTLYPNENDDNETEEINSSLFHN